MSGGTSTAATSSVSYTHLDVYKRQVTGSVANQYNALQLTILNRSEGQVDTLRLRFSDLLGTKATSNPNFRNGVDPHIWDDYGKAVSYTHLSR